MAGGRLATLFLIDSGYDEGWVRPAAGVVGGSFEALQILRCEGSAERAIDNAASRVFFRA